jgi:uncharacterized protein
MSEINDLPDSAFAFIAPGGRLDGTGRTMPRSLRMFPVHDRSHARMALDRAGQSPHGPAALPAIRAAAERYGVTRAADDDTLERRFSGPDGRAAWQADGLAVRAAADGHGPRIGGLAAVFGSLSRPIGGGYSGSTFVEQLLPAAFDQVRANGWTGCIARAEHSNAQLLGTVRAGTLTLAIERNAGLRYEVEPPQSGPAAGLVELVARGDIRHSSFAFRVDEADDGADEWTRPTAEQPYPLRTIHTVAELVDVSPVVAPAYLAATVGISAGLRSLARSMDLDPGEVDDLSARGQLWRLWNLPPRNPVSPHEARAQLITAKADPWAADDGPLNPVAAAYSREIPSRADRERMAPR